MYRRAFITMVGGSILAAPLGIDGQAEPMKKAGFSSVAVKIRVPGKEKTYAFMESSVYMAIKRGAPADRAWPQCWPVEHDVTLLGR